MESKRNKQTKTTITLILAVFLLVGAFPDLPYGFYQFLRMIVFIGIGWTAYDEFERGSRILSVFCAFVAILFNPFIRVFFRKETWRQIDLWLAALLVAWLAIDAAGALIKRKRK